MEVKPDDLPEHNIPLAREIYLSPEQIAVKGLVDEIDRKVFKTWEKKDE